MNGPSPIIDYIAINEQIEQITQWAYLFSMAVSFGGCGLCAVLATYINYYIFDLKDDSFLVPTPLM